MDAKVGFILGVIGSDELDGVLTIWSIGWDVPSEVHGEDLLEVLGLWNMVLVVEGGTVPIDMNVDIIDVDIWSKNTSKGEGEVRALGDWIWGVVSGMGIEFEATDVITALFISDLTAIGEAVGLDSDSRDQVLDEVLGDVVLDWNLTHHNVVGRDAGNEEGGGKVFHF